MTSARASTPFLTGYPEPFSARAGDEIAFMLHSEGVDRLRTSLVRLDRGPGGPSSPVPGLAVEDIQAVAQSTRPGSYVSIDDPHARLGLSGAFTLHAIVFPTLPARGPQAILGRWQQEPAAGALLLIDDERPSVWLGVDGVKRAFQLDLPLTHEVWAGIVVTWDPTRGALGLHCRALVTSTNSRLGTLAGVVDDAQEKHWGVGGRHEPSESDFLIAAAAGRDRTGLHFNGKIEAPAVWDRVLDAAAVAKLLRGDWPAAAPVAQWDFAAEVTREGIASEPVHDRSGNGLHGRCHNGPARAVTGHTWNGVESDYRVAPEQYGAIHFHEDDLSDADWLPTLKVTIPDALPSAVYALRVDADGAVDHVPFVVRPAPDRPRAAAAVLLPSATYLAYSNQVPVFEAVGLEAASFRTPVLAPLDLRLYEHPEFGFSTYDRHADGSGIAYISRRRPILNLRPDYLNQGSLWAMPADLCLFDWLRAMGHDADVLTDEDLDADGVDLLRPYRAILTGTHPEYTSARMLDALESYVAGGGRLMYMGGNGFYWVVSFDPLRPWVMEVRKQGGSLAWRARPGEHRHSTTGEPGGLWRNRGRPPQKLVGVGFASQGFDLCGPFRRLPDSDDPRVDWIFEGVTRDGPIGDYGQVGGGAAGLELDRYDPDLGSPPGTLVLASSEELTDAYFHVVEEVDVMRAGLSGTYDPDVRADVVYFETPSGGAVFSTGSIAWCSSLGHNEHQNDVSHITDNVFRRFTSDQQEERAWLS